MGKKRDRQPQMGTDQHRLPQEVSPIRGICVNVRVAEGFSVPWRIVEGLRLRPVRMRLESPPRRTNLRRPGFSLAAAAHHLQRKDGGNGRSGRDGRSFSSVLTALPHEPAARAGCASLKAGRQEDGAAGMEKLNVEPRPGSLWTLTVPPWASTVCLTTARPRPVPPGLVRARARSTL